MLALIVARSYLHLLALRHQCEPVDLKSFKYYVRHGEETSWDVNDPLILYPYLAFGLGRQPVGVVGSRSGIVRSPCFFIYELGVHLVQIALCKNWPSEEDDSSLTKARQWAVEKLHEAETLVTLSFAEIARECLEYREAALPSEQLTLGNKHLVKIVLQLSNLKARLKASLNGNNAHSI